jgi:hypothetical protein
MTKTRARRRMLCIKELIADWHLSKSVEAIEQFAKDQRKLEPPLVSHRRWTTGGRERNLPTGRRKG